MFAIDCDDVAPEERFAYWADQNRHSFYYTDVTRPGADTQPFFGRAEGWQIADAVLGRQITDNYQAERTEQLIAEHETGAVILGCPRVSNIEASFERYTAITARPDDLLVFDADIEWTALAQRGVEYHAVVLPRARLHPYLGGHSKVRPRLIDTGNELHGMLLACTREFLNLRDSEGAAAEGAVQVISHLLAVVCGVHPGDDATIRGSLSEARLFQVSQFITGNLHNPALNAKMIAAHLGVSVRRLHGLYEPTGTSVARQILSARLERAREMLLLNPQKTVLEVAYTCGFYSHSTFYRCFTDLFGMTPGEFRRAGNHVAQ
ncbi:MAG: helix-turn-helix domain-containing protein [Rhodobiaceae bacterium]|nr:helix-turn-helix domain-containing protein [Rhodobiaceae bacterium]MCC0049190.1 helix-turn-helix domain-containing protein [Rhodobiaceae bacterium]